MAGEEVFLCCGGDMGALPVPPQTPKMCAYLGLACYPKMGCCMKVKDILADDAEALAGVDNIKEEWMVCSSCCLGPICAENNYCLMPFTCCYGESQCLCCADDCAFPCTDKVPMTCGILCPGLIIYPQFGC